MSKLYDEIEKYCDKLQHEAELKKLSDIKESRNSKSESEVMPN